MTYAHTQSITLLIVLRVGGDGAVFQRERAERCHVLAHCSDDVMAAVVLTVDGLDITFVADEPRRVF